MTSSVRTPQAILGVIALSLLGLALIALGAERASDGQALAQQVDDLNIAVFGALLAGAAQGGWLIAARTEIRQRRHALTSGLTTAGTTSPSAVEGPATGADRVVVAGGSWSHRADCRLVVGKSPTPVDATSVVDCPVCGVRRA